MGGMCLLHSEVVERATRAGGALAGRHDRAEMACLAPQSVGKLVLVNAFGLWLDPEPVPDVFAMTPHELLPLLFPTADMARTWIRPIRRRSANSCCKRAPNGDRGQDSCSRSRIAVFLDAFIERQLRR